MFKLKPGSSKRGPKDRQIGSPQHRNMAVGHFFLHLGHRLLGGKIKPFTYEYGDIENPDLGLIIEVKGCNNQHQFCIYSDQIERFLTNLFPFNYCIFSLFSYRNQFEDKSLRISRAAGTERSLYKVLAARTTALYLLDAEIITAIKH